MSGFTFRPAEQFTERAGLFVGLTGGTNSGKSFSALRLGRGIAGPTGKLAVLDTEGGRMLHLKRDFAFDIDVMEPPFRPERFSQAAKAAEEAGYGALVIDSFSMEWVGIGGVLDWQAAEIKRLAGENEAKQKSMKSLSWVAPKMAHKSMVYSFLQRRIPIIFSIRGEETFKPGNDKPTFKAICNKSFPFEITVSFRLETERKGYVDLSDPESFKMEGAHESIFRHGDRISEEHGAALAEWAKGVPPARVDPVLAAEEAARSGVMSFRAFWNRLGREEREPLRPRLKELQTIAEKADADDDPFAGETAPTESTIADFPGDRPLATAAE